MAHADKRVPHCDFCGEPRAVVAVAKTGGLPPRICLDCAGEAVAKLSAVLVDVIPLRRDAAD